MSPRAAGGPCLEQHGPPIQHAPQGSAGSRAGSGCRSQRSGPVLITEPTTAPTTKPRAAPPVPPSTRAISSRPPRAYPAEYPAAMPSNPPRAAVDNRVPRPRLTSIRSIAEVGMWIMEAPLPGGASVSVSRLRKATLPISIVSASARASIRMRVPVSRGLVFCPSSATGVNAMRAAAVTARASCWSGRNIVDSFTVRAEDCCLRRTLRDTWKRSHRHADVGRGSEVRRQVQRGAAPRRQQAKP
jgi:hypothetical protein